MSFCIFQKRSQIDGLVIVRHKMVYILSRTQTFLTLTRVKADSATSSYHFALSVKPNDLQCDSDSPPSPFLSPSLFHMYTHTHTHTHKNRLATVYSSDQNLCDTHTEHNYSFLTSHLSPGPQTLPLGVGQLLSLAANVTVTQVIGTLCSLSGLSPPLLAPPPVKQRKFSQRAINIK